MIQMIQIIQEVNTGTAKSKNNDLKTSPDGERPGEGGGGEGP